MPPPLPPLRNPGEKILASEWNMHIDATKKIALQVDRTRPPVARKAQPWREPAVIAKVYNNSGQALKALNIGGIVGRQSDDEKEPTILELDVPSDGAGSGETDTRGRFCILIDDLADQEIGQAYIAGACLCQVSVVDADDGYADIYPADETQLKSGATGPAQILWKESGTGTKWAVVQWPQGGGVGARVVKLTTDPDANFKADVKYVDVEDGVGTVGGDDFTAEVLDVEEGS